MLGRRDFLRLGAGGLAGAALLGSTGCGIFDGSSGDEGSVVFNSAGGSLTDAFQRAWKEPFTKETGIKVTMDAPTDYAKLQSMVEADQVTWDVVEVEETFGLEDPDALFEPLDYSVIDTTGIADGDRSKHGVSFMVYTVVLGFNTETFRVKPASWNDFFDLEKFPGNRGFPGSMFGNPLEIALLADSVPKEDLYPLDIDRALAKLDTIRDSLVFWESGAPSQQQIADGEVVMSATYNGRIQNAVENGAPFDMSWNQYIRLTDQLVIPKGSPNKEQAMELIAYIVAPDNNWRLARYIPYGPTNRNAIDRVPQDVASKLPTTGSRPQEAVNLSLDWYRDNYEAATERYSEWALG